MNKFVTKLYDYGFTGEIKIEESKNEKEIPTMAMDKDQDSVDEKTEEKKEDVSKLLVSYKISDEEEIETIVV